MTTRLQERYHSEVAPALANAVYDATGIRFRDLPLTPERIFERLRDVP